MPRTGGHCKNVQRTYSLRCWKILEAFHFAEKQKQKFLFFFPPVGEASEYLREIGGLMFINDLAKSSAHCIVKEAALFTLGIIIESNGNKNNIVCISECAMAPCHYLCSCFVSIFFWSHKMRLQACQVEQGQWGCPSCPVHAWIWSVPCSLVHTGCLWGSRHLHSSLPQQQGFSDSWIVPKLLLGVELTAGGSPQALPSPALSLLPTYWPQLRLNHLGWWVVYFST